MAGFWKHGNEPVASIKSEEFLGLLCEYSQDEHCCMQVGILRLCRKMTAPILKENSRLHVSHCTLPKSVVILNLLVG